MIGQPRLSLWAAGHPTTIFRHSLFSAIISLGCCRGPQSITLFVPNSQALGAHFEGAMGGTGFTVTCRQHGAASWAHSCLLQKCPDVQNSWCAGSCGLSARVGGGAGSHCWSTGAGREGAAWHSCRCSDTDVQSSSNGDGANHSALACPLLHRHRSPCWTWGQTAQRGRTAQL